MDHPALKPEMEDYEDLRTLCDETARSPAEPARSLGDVLKDIGI